METVAKGRGATRGIHRRSAFINGSKQLPPFQIHIGGGTLWLLVNPLDLDFVTSSEASQDAGVPREAVCGGSGCPERSVTSCSGDDAPEVVVPPRLCSRILFAFCSPGDVRLLSFCVLTSSEHTHWVLLLLSPPPQSHPILCPSLSGLHALTRGLSQPQPGVWALGLLAAAFQGTVFHLEVTRDPFPTEDRP